MASQKQREEINRKLVSMQMEIIGLTYEDAVNTPEFWRVYTLTTQQTEEWRVEALKLVRKTFKCNKARGLEILGWFELNLGLRIDDYPRTTGKTTSSIPQDIIIPKETLTLWQRFKKLLRL